MELFVCRLDVSDVNLLEFFEEEQSDFFEGDKLIVGNFLNVFVFEILEVVYEIVEKFFQNISYDGVV